jgi:chromosome segregation ATPase
MNSTPNNFSQLTAPPPLIIETPNNFNTIFTFSKPTTTKHESLDNLDKIQNIMELETHIHNLKGHNEHNMIEIKKLKDQIKLYKQANISEEVRYKKLKDQYNEAQDEIKSLQEQQVHNELGFTKIKELNKSLQEQNIHNESGITKLKETIKTLQDKIIMYENEIKTLTEQHNNNIIEIQNLQKQPVKYKLEAIQEEPPKIKEPENISDKYQAKINELESQIFNLSKNNIKKEQPTGCW